METYRKVTTVLLMIWQVFLMVSAFVLNQSEWWLWCAISYIIAVAIVCIERAGADGKKEK